MRGAVRGVRPFQGGEEVNGAKLLLWAVSLFRRDTEGNRGDVQNEGKKNVSANFWRTEMEA